jgi:hypothetical protein
MVVKPADGDGGVRGVRARRQQKKEERHRTNARTACGCFARQAAQQQDA